jgi:hypothetical protein
MTKTEEAPYEVAREVLDFYKVAIKIISKPAALGEQHPEWAHTAANDYFRLLADINAGRAVII